MFETVYSIEKRLNEMDFDEIRMQFINVEFEFRGFQKPLKFGQTSI